MVDEGARVFISSRDVASLKATAKQIGAAGWHAADVSKAGEPEAAVEAAAKQLGGSTFWSSTPAVRRQAPSKPPSSTTGAQHTSCF